MKKFYKIVILLFLSTASFSQINFTSLPGDLELIPRDSADYARFSVSGTCPSTVTAMKVTISGSMTVSEEKYVKIANGSFQIPLRLQARLTEYTLIVSFYDGTGKETDKKIVNDIVAGDVFIIGGQSNAMAPPDNDSVGRLLDSGFVHHACRSIGTHPSLAIEANISMSVDSRFSRPTCRAWYQIDKGFLGVWGLKLQHDLAIRTGIPNCFVNSSIGATAISTHFASHTPSNPDSLLFELDSAKKSFRLYDRVYKKLYHNRLCDNVKAIFWYQGETDCNPSAAITREYVQRFDTLYTSWKADYPSFERLYMMQLNTGCGDLNASLMRQLQSNIAASHADITIMSTVGSGPSEKAGDGCHYTSEGYLRIAENLVPVVCAEIYHHDIPTAGIYPPKLVKAYYQDEATICVEFDRDIASEDSMYYANGNKHWIYMKDYFYDETGSGVKAARVSHERNKFFLHFNEKKVVKKLTYLPQAYNELPAVYTGPWIVNAGNNRLGALSFYEAPVEYNVTDASVQVYPNPADEVITIKYLPWKKINSVSLTDLSGKIIIQAEIDLERTTLELGDLDPGIYILKVHVIDGSGIFKKVIVRH